MKVYDMILFLGPGRYELPPERHILFKRHGGWLTIKNTEEGWVVYWTSHYSYHKKNLWRSAYLVLIDANNNFKLIEQGDYYLEEVTVISIEEEIKQDVATHITRAIAKETKRCLANSVGWLSVGVTDRAIDERLELRRKKIKDSR